MSKILMTGFYPGEMQTFLPLYEQLSRAGHDVRLLVPEGCARPYPDMVRTYYILPGSGWLRGVLQILEQFHPDFGLIAVDGPNARATLQAFKASNIPRLNYIPVMTEFKEPATLGFLINEPEEDYIVASSRGEHVLQTLGVNANRIYILGSPCFDWMDGWKYKGSGEFVMLLADQATEQTYGVAHLLFKYMETNLGAHLAIRKHPRDLRSNIETWLREIAARPDAGRRAHVRSGTAQIGHDLATCSVVIGCDSLALYEAAVVGVPAISFSEYITPIAEPNTDLRRAITHVASARALYKELDILSRGFSTAPIGQPRDLLTGPATPRYLELIQRKLSS